jgi:hypothetical protein
MECAFSELGAVLLLCSKLTRDELLYSNAGDADPGQAGIISSLLLNSIFPSANRDAELELGLNKKN